MPALYALMLRRLLPSRFAIVGVARSEGDDDSFRADMEQAVRRTRATSSARTCGTSSPRRCTTSRRTLPTTRRGRTSPSGLGRSTRSTGSAATASTTCAVPPAAFPTIVEALGERRDATTGWARLIVEKPFGHDLASARALNRDAARRTSRRSRSTGSTTTSARRRSRTCWSSASPTASSSRSGTASSSTTSRSPWPSRSAIEGRAGYYESAGAIRDIFQNHLLQLLALTAMEPPIDFTRRVGAEREGEGAEVAAYAGAEVGRARPVRARLRRGRGGARRTARSRASRRTR